MNKKYKKVLKEIFEYVHIYVENYDVKCYIPEVISGLKYIQNPTYFLLFVLYEMLRNLEV